MTLFPLSGNVGNTRFRVLPSFFFIPSWENPFFATIFAALKSFDISGCFTGLTSAMTGRIRLVRSFQGIFPCNLSVQTETTAESGTFVVQSNRGCALLHIITSLLLKFLVESSKNEALVFTELLKNDKIAVHFQPVFLLRNTGRNCKKICFRR